MPGQASIAQQAPFATPPCRTGSAAQGPSTRRDDVEIDFTEPLLDLRPRGPAGFATDRGLHAEPNRIGPRSMERLVTDMVEVAERLRRRIRDLPVDVGPSLGNAKRSRDLLADVEDDLIVLLARNGIEREDPTGSPFDPRCHHRVAEQQSSYQAAGTIVETLACTWWMNGHLLRPGMVRVAKAALPAGTDDVDPPSTPSKLR